MDRFARQLRETDERKFRYTAELADMCVAAIMHVDRKYGLSNGEACDAMLMALTSFVQSHAPPDDWNRVGGILVEELRERLCIRQIGH